MAGTDLNCICIRVFFIVRCSLFGAHFFRCFFSLCLGANSCYAFVHAVPVYGVSWDCIRVCWTKFIGRWAPLPAFLCKIKSPTIMKKKANTRQNHPV